MRKGPTLSLAGAEAYDRKNYDLAFSLILPAAQRGEPVSQMLIATMYQHGLGVPKDFPTSLSWAVASAKKGNAEAIMLVAESYFFGQGNQRNSVIGFALAIVAAEFNEHQERKEHIPKSRNWMSNRLSDGDKNLAKQLSNSIINSGLVVSLDDFERLTSTK